MSSALTPEQILNLDHDWYHTVTLTLSAATPGLVDLRPYVPMAGFPDDMTGMKALDVGSYDGFWAFEMERRGASVIAVDVDRMPWPDVARIHRASFPNREKTGDGFRALHTYFGSSVERRVVDAADVSPATVGEGFDLAFVGALLLHLRDPTGLLENLRDVLKTGGTLLCMEPIDMPLSTGPHAKEPTARFCLSTSRHSWWYPNRACLQSWMTGAGFGDVRIVADGPIADTHGDVQHTTTLRALSPTTRD